MIFPVKNYYDEWKNDAGYKFGQKINANYFHDGLDINDNGAGDSDLGKPLYAIANGIVVGIHSHSTQNTFGKHFFIQIDGAWGTRYVHYAHCNEIFITEGQQVKEGDKIATVGKTGTKYAHCHFAVKKKANGMDTVATTKPQLDDAWEDPIAFVERYIGTGGMATITQKELDEIRIARDTNYNDLQTEKKKTEQLTNDLKSEQEHSGELIRQLEKISDEETHTTEQLLDAQKANKTLQDRILELEKIKTPDTPQPKIIYRNMPKDFIGKLKVLFS